MLVCLGPLARRGLQARGGHRVPMETSGRRGDRDRRG